MIFLNNALNSELYDPENNPDTTKYKYSKMGLCKALYDFSVAFEEEDFFEVFFDSSKIRIDWEKIKDNVKYRTASDISRVIFYKPEFKSKLELLGVVEPYEGEGSYDYACYLQLCYFFYLMDNYIFSDVRFFDLFKEKNWSSENVSDSGTGNEVYQRFIMSSLFNDNHYRNLDRCYEESFDRFQDAFFSWYELQTYKFTRENYLDIPGKQSIIPESRLPEFAAIIHARMDEIAVLSDEAARDRVTKLTPYDTLLARLKRYEALSTQKDYYENLNLIDLSSAIKMAELVKSRIPKGYRSTYIAKEDIGTLMDDMAFISSVIGKQKLVQKDLDRVHNSDIQGALLGIWDYEEDQLSRPYASGIFTFITKNDDGNYVMSLEDVLIIAITRVYLPKTTKYYSKRTYLYDRSDGIKTNVHSLRLSFDAVDVDGFKAKKSMLRNDVFRIMCRTVAVISSNGLDEFLNFELPMNKAIIAFERIPENYPCLEQRSAWFESSTFFMESDSMEIWKFLESD